MTATTEDYNAGNAQAMAHAKKCWFEVRKQTRQNRVRRLNLVNETFVGRSSIFGSVFTEIDRNDRFVYQQLAFAGSTLTIRGSKIQ